jgi:hypothetical protein
MSELEEGLTARELAALVGGRLVARAEASA